jgi:hypothetical protein
VADALQHDRVPFHRICQSRGQWGSIACFVTRHRAFASQRADYQLLLEDDLFVGAGFLPLVRSLIESHYCATTHAYATIQIDGGARRLKHQRCTRGGVRTPCFDPRTPPDVVQLGSYGEAFLTSFNGAARLAREVREHGILGCADQQYNVGRMMNLTHAWSQTSRRSWRLLVPTNSGDRSQTRDLSPGESAALRECTAPGYAGRCLLPREADRPRADGGETPVQRMAGAFITALWGCVGFVALLMLSCLADFAAATLQSCCHSSPRL